MLKRAGAEFIILGHSDNRSEGETNQLIKKKIKSALNEKLNIIFCIGETFKEKKSGKTFFTLRKKIIKFIKSEIKKIFKKDSYPKILYGGSVNDSNIRLFSSISDIDGFLIGGASQSSKKFIDIVKNYYK